MSYKKALEDIGILRERNVSRLQQLAEELDPKDADHDDDVNIYKHLCRTKLSLFTNILRNLLCYVSYCEFLMNDIHDTTLTE